MLFRSAKGLLSTGPKVGTRVLAAAQWNWFDPDVVAWQSRAGLSREFLRDLQELRRIVEPAAVRLAAERATPQDIAEIEAAYAGMKDAIEHGGDYVQHDLAFHQGLLRACHNLMVEQMSKALGALLRTSFEISTTRPDGPAQSLPLHRAVLDAVIARSARSGSRAITASSTARCNGSDSAVPSRLAVLISKLVRSSAASALLICTIRRLPQARSRPWWKARSCST